MEHQETKVTRVEVLKEIKSRYGSLKPPGLCNLFSAVLRLIFHLEIPDVEFRNNQMLFKASTFVPFYFPKFQPPKGKNWNEYWWPVGDHKSRLAFIDYLMEEYKDDETNLLDISSQVLTERLESVGATARVVKNK